MTIEKAIKDFLETNGLDNTESTQIIKDMKTTHTEMENRWQEDAAAYPPSMIGVLLMSASSHAKIWLEKNYPKHWALGMFH